MSITTNAAAVALRMRNAEQAVRAELAGEGPLLAQRIAAEMRRRAPKFVSILANSINVQRTGPYDFIIKPTAAYAASVEKGRKPGKGLPRFFDPASASAVAWIAASLGAAARAINPKYRPGARGTARHTAEELALRDRYFLWSRAVKQRGIKATPFVKPTADAMRGDIQAALVAAVQRGLKQMRGGGA